MDRVGVKVRVKVRVRNILDRNKRGINFATRTTLSGAKWYIIQVPQNGGAGGFFISCLVSVDERTDIDLFCMVRFGKIRKKGL